MSNSAFAALEANCIATREASSVAPRILSGTSMPLPLDDQETLLLDGRPQKETTITPASVRNVFKNDFSKASEKLPKIDQCVSREVGHVYQKPHLKAQVLEGRHEDSAAPSARRFSVWTWRARPTGRNGWLLTDLDTLVGGVNRCLSSAFRRRRARGYRGE